MRVSDLAPRVENSRALLLGPGSDESAVSEVTPLNNAESRRVTSNDAGISARGDNSGAVAGDLQQEI